MDLLKKIGGPDAPKPSTRNAAFEYPGVRNLKDKPEAPPLEEIAKHICCPKRKDRCANGAACIALDHFFASATAVRDLFTKGSK